MRQDLERSWCSSVRMEEGGWGQTEQQFLPMAQENVSEPTEPFPSEECDTRRRIRLHCTRLTIGRVVLYVQHDWGPEKDKCCPLSDLILELN